MKKTIVLLCIALSGAAGLIYEIVWLKKAALVYGAATPALSTVLAVFFGGLALGSWLFGRWTPRLARPMQVYAYLELALAAVALLATFAFGPLDSLYGAIFRSLSDQPWLLGIVRMLLVAVALLPPTILMGGTLPLISRQFAVRSHRLAGTVAWLYALNTLGAAAGCALAGFVLLPAIGLLGTVLVGVVCNLAAGLGVLYARLPGPEPAEATKKPEGDSPAPGAWIRLVAGLFALLGFTSLAAEVLWSRFLTLLVHDTVHTWAITLTVVLLGIVLGSWLVGRFADRRRDPALLLGTLLGLAAVSTVLLPYLPVNFLRGLGDQALPFLVVLLPPAIFAGACLPAALRLVAVSPKLVGLDVGRLIALNTGGGILGSLLAGFVLLPGLGLQISLLVISGCGLVGALLALLVLPQTNRRQRLGSAIVLGLAWLAIPLLANVRVPADYLAPRDQLVAWQEGRNSTLAAVKQAEHLILQIDRLWQGRDGRNHQIMAAHVPALLHPDPRRVCVVGIGVGQTASRFLMHETEQLDCVDIDADIFPFIRDHFAAHWLDDPRVHTATEDGRTFVVHGRGDYDLISIEVGQTFRPGAETFYTREFYASAAERLAPGGIVAQFVPLPFLDEAALRAVVATFIDVFPHSVLWYNTAELLLIGGEGWQLDPERILRVENDPALAGDLAYSQWGGTEFYLNNLGNFLGGFICGPDALAQLAADAEPMRDNRPWLVYATREARAESNNATELAPILTKLATSPAALLSSPVSDDVLAAMDRTRDLNLADLVAADHVAAADRYRSAGDLPKAVGELNQALRTNPESAEATRVLGDALAQANRTKEAARWLRRALMMRPDDILVARGLGGLLVQMGQSAEAVALLKPVVEARPSDNTAWNSLGAALGEMGRLEEAIVCFKRVIAIDPEDTAARQNLQRAQAQLRHSRARK